nr:hypothetical protein [Tanacetum cinerariifolium]
MVADLRYFNSLESEVDSLRSQLETQKTQFLNEIDRLSREYYYADHMNAILGVYTELDEVTNLQCDYLELLEKCEGLETELSKSKMILNAKTLNVKSVCATRDTCMLNDKHDMCVLKSVAKPLKETVASESNKKPRNFIRKLYERKFLGTVKFGNDQIAPILGYGDLVQGAVTLKTVGLNHNLFSVGQLCDADLEVSFRKSTCYNRDLKGTDLLTGSRGTDLYSIKLQDINSPNLICLMAKATSSQAWLWHRRLSHLNFDTINLLSKNDIVVGLPKLKFVKDHLCSSCELGKAKRKSFHTKLTPSSKRRLVQRGLQVQVRVVRTDKGSEFLNQTLHAYFAADGIHHQTSIARTPEQNGVVERRNRTLVEAARTMLSAAKVPLFFWAEAIVIACFTQNRSLVIPRHEKTPYHIINDRKPSVKFFHIFGSKCYIVRDGENLDKMKEKDQLSSDPAPECQTMALNHDNLSPVVSKTSAVSAADTPNQRQQHTNPLNTHTTHAPTCQVQSHAPSVTSSENINQADTNAKNDQVADDEFINIFCTSVQDQGETSSRHVDSSNMHTFYQRYPSEHRWTKDHPLEQVIGNPSQSQSVRTRRQLESDAEMCMFALTETLHQFHRLDVWELLDRPLCTNVINLKWLWKNKRDEENTVIRNKSRLVAKGYAQKEGVDFKESLTPV